MHFIEFLQLWFYNDLAVLGTIFITVIASVMFIYETIQKVKENSKVKATLFFIAYLITLLGLILIILQSLHNIQTTKAIETRLDKIEQSIQKEK